MLLLATLAAHASVYTPEDLVVAHARGLPASVTAQLAEGVGTEPETAVYLLRRGVSADVLATWGYVVGDAERAEAARFGALAAAPPVAPHAWTDPAVLTAVVYEAKEDVRLPTERPRVAHLNRGRAGVVAGAVLAVAGGVTFVGGARGTSEGVLVGQSCCVGAMDVYTVVEQIPPSPNLVMMGIGAVGLLGAGVSFQFGAHELRLAGAHPGGWEPTPAR